MQLPTKTAMIFAALESVVGPALATPLAPGAVIFPTGVTFADPVHGGVQTVINDNLIGFSLDPTPITPLTTVGGNVQNRVTETAGGTLNFAPRIRDTFNIDGGTFAISAFRLTGFGMFDLDVDFRTDGLGDKGFSSVSRSLSGDIMTFRYDDPLFIDAIIPPGRQEESLFPSIVSDATDYNFDGTMKIFGYVLPLGATVPNPTADLISVTIDGVAVPTTLAPVPLPASSLFLAVGIAGLFVARRRKT
ncbi:MAG: VPLPA-CTERM sorting domain-containing protein [Pseudomonadota bacterium]